MKLASIILQIIAFVLLATSVTVIMFIRPYQFSGIAGKINKLLECLRIRTISGRTKLVYILILLAVFFV